MSRKSGVGDKSPALSSESSLSSVQQEWDELELEAVETVSTIRRTETISPPITRRKAKGTQKRTAPDDSGSRKKVKHSKTAVLPYQEDTGLPDESTQTSTSKKRRSQGKTRVNGNNAQDISVEIEEELVEVETVAEGNTSTKKQKNKKLSKVKGASQTSREGEEQGEKPKRRRKTKEEKEAEAMPLAARTVGLRMYIGAHVSTAKGRVCVLCFSTKAGSKGRWMSIISLCVDYEAEFFLAVFLGVHNSVTNSVHIG